jgi:hypothetical protein
MAGAVVIKRVLIPRIPGQARDAAIQRRDRIREEERNQTLRALRAGNPLRIDLVVTDPLHGPTSFSRVSVEGRDRAKRATWVTNCRCCGSPVEFSATTAAVDKSRLDVFFARRCEACQAREIA